LVIRTGYTLIIEQGNTQMTIATEILKQLGGNRFIAMTGAKNLIDAGEGLRFAIPNSNGINRVEITLEPGDTYRVTFTKFNARSLATRIVHTVGNVYCDQLQELFTNQTGLYTKF
jgi:hypothetical protein